MSEDLKTYSYEEIAEHSNIDSLWLLIEDNVYDVTRYLSEHPGGEDVMLEQAGEDATDAFIEAGHSFDARETMKYYKIGKLNEEAQKKKGKDKLISICYQVAVPLAVISLAICIYKIYAVYRK